MEKTGMTTYSYRCHTCGHTHDRPARADQATPPATVTCPECLSAAVRVWAVPAVHVVGGTGAGSRPRGNGGRR